MKKEDLKKITEKIDDISKKVDSIMHNRLIIAIFMIIDGVNFIINPINSMEFMARMVAVLAIFAAFAVVATNLKSQNKDIKSIIIANIMIIICLYMLVFPKILVINLRVWIATFIIFNGLINIFNIMKLNKVSLWMCYTENKIKNKLEKEEIDDEKYKEIIVEQTGKVINPITSFMEKSKKNSYLYFLLNIISIVLGICLFTTYDRTLIICGVILIYTGACDFLMFSKSINLSKKLIKTNK